jgi:hypothetical protein
MGISVENYNDINDLDDYAREALSREKPTWPMITVLHEACNGCVKQNFMVTNACRGCFARPCMVNCPKKAIHIVHHAHIDAMGMNGKIAMELPLYIVNGNIDKAEAWNGPCNQLDVFTTILDVLNIKNDWHGLGHTLLSPDYENSVTPQIWDISEMIIEGNYFGD